MLVLMFVIPHDPSTSLMPNRVGSDAYRVSPRAVHHKRAHASELSQPPTPRHATPAASATTMSSFLGTALRTHGSSTEHSDLLRLVRLARARPHAVLRIARDAVSYSVEEVVRAGVSSDAYEVRGAANATSLGWSTSVEELRDQYGEKTRWWGDLSPAETRALYHALLPKSLLEEEDAEYTLAERAELAIAARRAARLYARERALLPFAIASELLDGVRQLMCTGAFRTAGPDDETIWKKYGGCLPSELPDGAAFQDEVYYTILRKACSSNRQIDMLCGNYHGGVFDAAVAASEYGSNL